MAVPQITNPAPDINGLFAINLNDVGYASRDAILAATIEGNAVSHTDRGISLGGTGFPTISWSQQRSNPISAGVVITGNTFDDIDTEIVDPGTKNTVYWP